jgi:hypothetical protein
MIVILRNPVDRAYSHYQMALRKGFEDLSFEDAIEQEPSRVPGEAERLEWDENYRSSTHIWHSYLARGIYVDQLCREGTRLGRVGYT